MDIKLYVWFKNARETCVEVMLLPLMNISVPVVCSSVQFIFNFISFTHRIILWRHPRCKYLSYAYNQVPP